MTTAYGLPCWFGDWGAQLGWGGFWISDLAGHYGVGAPFWASDVANRSDYTPMSVSVDDVGQQSTPGSATQFTVYCHVSAGSGSYTNYVWNYAVVGGGGAPAIIGGGNGQNYATFYVDVGWDGSCDFAYNCTVTDSTGAQVGSQTPVVNIYSYYDPGMFG